MFLRSLQWRLVTIFISFTLVLMIALGVIMNMSVEGLYYNNFKDGINEGFKNWGISESANPSATDVYNQLEVNRFKSFFYIIGDYKSYTVMDSKNNSIVFSSDKYYVEHGEASFYNEIMQSPNLINVMAGKTKEGSTKRLMNYDKRSYYDYAKQVGESIIYFRYNIEDSKKAVDNFNTIIINSLMIVVVSSFIIGYILSKTITVPIVNIMHRAQRIAKGDFDQILEVKSSDEIGKLTATFNYMARALKRTLAETSSEKRKIETILNYMTDGVIAFNIKGEIIHANPASRAILGVERMSLSFNDFSKKYNLGIDIEEIQYLENSGSKERNIELENRFIRVYFALFTDEAKRVEGIIAVMQDITEQQKLENMRKEFVANVSHELRTPLTSIKSYAETLLDGALDDRDTSERFLGVINSEADRMTRLVKDLLQLSRLDNQQMSWSIKQISIVNLVKSSVEKMQIEAKNKDQKLESYVIGEIPEITADRDRIEQVLINLLSNAIKYTSNGGQITVYVGRLYSEVYIKVTDTGIGIPKEDLPRIFERFYRVDKARSREMGGTGLGLAIAKEIVDAHDGSISIISEWGKGTEITVKLPINTAKNM